MAFQKIKPVPLQNAMNAVIYARYSSDKQTENSIDGQLRACQQYAEQHGYSIVGEYIDRAMSGTNDNRPEFQRMIEDSAKQQFAFIIVYRFDRFSRNRYDSAIYKKKLEAVGVRVLSASEQIGDGDEGIILESIYEAMDEAYSRRLSRITKRGMREAAIKGLWTGGVVPLGYKVEDQRLVIDERTAPIVRQIFELYASGLTKRQVADALNAKGYRTKHGKLFTHANFTSIMRNTMYYGDYAFDDVERTCPAIVDKALFDRVQRIETANKKCFGRKVEDTFFLLGGKLFCGYCGSAMIGDSGTSQSGDRHFYYTCGKRKKAHTCKKRSERKGFIEWYVCEQTVNFVLAEPNIKMIAQRVADKAAEENRSDAIPELEKRVRAINDELDRLTDVLIQSPTASVSRRVNERSAALEQELATVEKELSQLRLRQSLVITAENVEQYLRQFCKGDLLDEEFQRRLINTLINCVYLFDDKLVIYYNIRGCQQVSHIELLSDMDELVDPDEAGNCSDSIGYGEPQENPCKHYVFKGFSVYKTKNNFKKNIIISLHCFARLQISTE